MVVRTIEGFGGKRALEIEHCQNSKFWMVFICPVFSRYNISKKCWFSWKHLFVERKTKETICFGEQLNQQSILNQAKNLSISQEPC